MSQQNKQNSYGGYGYNAPYYPYANVNPALRNDRQQYAQYPAGYPGTTAGYQQGQGPQTGQPAPGQQAAAPGAQPGAGMLPAEESYIENILRLNRGKLATVYATFEGSREWNSKVFKGIIEAAGRDHLILSDPQTGMRYLLTMVSVDYVTFDEEIEYEYPYAGGGGLAAYPPR
ncbi:spore coat protein GerQ [Peribacillus glennii]|uniref:Spore coat protein GerQ n=1 Tax=Peribacillus glennii TaxID=2303991 RepID=A0A372L9Y6_9BACI|nr:spore coat protein GerQ [Peribacillus glennii]RFU62377.1 spore coat protein GerQ [Peribacillus glennii]